MCADIAVKYILVLASCFTGSNQRTVYDFRKVFFSRYSCLIHVPGCHTLIRTASLTPCGHWWETGGSIDEVREQLWQGSTDNRPREFAIIRDRLYGDSGPDTRDTLQPSEDKYSIEYQALEHNDFETERM